MLLQSHNDHIAERITIALGWDPLETLDSLENYPEDVLLSLIGIMLEPPNPFVGPESPLHNLRVMALARAAVVEANRILWKRSR